jgi:hypothetical protein
MFGCTLVVWASARIINSRESCGTAVPAVRTGGTPGRTPLCRQFCED